MFRRLALVLCLLAVVTLGNTGDMTADQKATPEWEVVFDAAPLVAPEATIYSVTQLRDQLYLSVSNPLGASVFSSRDGEKWEQVSSPGLGDPQYTELFSLVPFDGFLYAGLSQAPAYALPGKIMRSANGRDWEESFVAEPDELGGGYIVYLHVFNGMIYMTCQGPLKVFRSPSGAPGTWEVVADLGLFTMISPIMNFKGAMYLSSYGWIDGVEVNQLWRSFDGNNWEGVGGDISNDPEVFNQGIDLGSYKGYLYYGTLTWDYNAGFFGGARIYRSQDGLNWELVVKGGFGDPMNIVCAGFVKYKGDFYVSSWSIATGLVDIWSSQTGEVGTWEFVSGGLGEPYVSFSLPGGSVVFKGHLYVLTGDALYIYR